MKKHLIFAVLLAVIAGTCWELGRRGAEAYERVLITRIESALDVLGIRWARIRADGLKLELHGHAPDLFSRDLALETARATASIARVTNFATATLAPPEQRSPVRVELHRAPAGVTMIGQTSSRAMRDTLNEALRQNAPDMSVQDLTGIQAAEPPKSWGSEVEVATYAATVLPNAFVTIEPGTVSVQAQTDTEERRAQVTAELLSRADDHVTVILRLSTPDEVIAPFTFTAQRDAGAGIRVESCAVRSAAEQAIVAGTLEAGGTERGADHCTVGLGGPEGDWPQAIRSSLAALNDLPAGRLELTYQDIKLIGLPPSSPTLFAEVVSSLEEGVPTEFIVTGELRTDDAASRLAMERARYWMSIAAADRKVTIAGKIGSDADLGSIRTYAAALFGTDAVSIALEEIPEAAPRDWVVAAMRTLEAATQIKKFEATLVDQSLRIRGDLAEPSMAPDMHDVLVDALENFSVETRFRIDAPAALAEIPLPPARCAAELMAGIADRPIDFSTGSGALTDESLPVLDVLARILARCEPDTIEVSGHTDSQGSESLNERLSNERATMVREALIDRGVMPSQLVAKGYGESQPIADNSTDEGRARNRRIEFKPRAE